MTTVLLSIAVLGILGAVFGAVLAFAAQIFHVEVDPKQEAVRACLAGANCGGCGFPGCDGYAAAVAKGEAATNRCVAGGAEAAAKVAEVMGVSADAMEKKVAFVPCSGTEGHAIIDRGDLYFRSNKVEGADGREPWKKLPKSPVFAACGPPQISMEKSPIV